MISLIIGCSGNHKTEITKEAQLPVDSILEDNWLGDDVDLYKGRIMSFRDSDEYGQTYVNLSNVFYESEKAIKSGKVAFPEKGSYGTVTEKRALIGKIFHVDSVIPSRTLEDEYGMSIQDPVLVISDTSDGSKLYFRYDIDYSFNFPFKCVNLKWVKLDSNYCRENIEVRYDQFTDVMTYSSHIMEPHGSTDPLPVTVFLNTGKDKPTVYTISLTIRSTSRTSADGAYILFDDSTKIQSPTEPVDNHYMAGKYDYYLLSSSISLSESDIDILCRKPIKAIKVGSYDNYISDNLAKELMAYTRYMKKQNTHTN